MKIIRQPETIIEAGSIKVLPDICSRKSSVRPLIVTDKGIMNSGMYSAIEDVLLKAGIKFSLYTDIKPDPTIDSISEIVSFAEKESIDMVIGLGGGSSIDSAKLAAALLTNKGDIYSYLGTDLLKNEALPLIAIPTTAGTGSEVTPIAILSDEKEKLKKGVVSDKLIPMYAVLDPALTAGMPKQITAFTGMDALIHSIEAFISVNANEYTDMFAEKAIYLINGNLYSAYMMPGDLMAREKMLRGSYMAGIAFANAGVCAVHAFAYPLGGMFHIPHGLANSIMLLPVLKFNLQSDSAKYRKLADCFGVASIGALLERLEELSTQLNIPVRLRDSGITHKDIEPLAQNAIKVERLLKNNPKTISIDDAVSIYTAAY